MVDCALAGGALLLELATGVALSTTDPALLGEVEALVLAEAAADGEILTDNAALPSGIVTLCAADWEAVALATADTEAEGCALALAVGVLGSAGVLGCAGAVWVGADAAVAEEAALDAMAPVFNASTEVPHAGIRHSAAQLRRRNVAE